MHKGDQVRAIKKWATAVQVGDMGTITGLRADGGVDAMFPWGIVHFSSIHIGHLFEVVEASPFERSVQSYIRANLCA